jgi:putative transposase
MSHSSRARRCGLELLDATVAKNDVADVGLADTPRWLLPLEEAMYHRWRAQYGAMKADDVKRLKHEQENARLKRMVADHVLEVAEH